MRRRARAPDAFEEIAGETEGWNQVERREVGIGQEMAGVGGQAAACFQQGGEEPLRKTVARRNFVPRCRRGEERHGQLGETAFDLAQRLVQQSCSFRSPARFGKKTRKCDAAGG